MTVETLEEAAQAQLQMEDFARLAHAAKLAVEPLEDAFCCLEDSPEDVADAVPRLSRLADDIAEWALDWARMCNADFGVMTEICPP
jgi:hypothetical protein